MNNLLNSRNSLIDTLRGVSILLVLILHFNIAYHLDQSALTNIFSKNFIDLLAGNGNYGVTLFFVISGFLITTTSLERYNTLNNLKPIDFYTLRFSRLMPCLILSLGIILIFSFLNIAIFKNKPGSVSMGLTIFSILTFWHNVLMAKAGYFNYCLNILWSLSVEEVFYITLPILCLIFKQTRWLILFWAGFIILGPIYRNFYSQNEIMALYGYFSCFDAIAMGCIAAIISQHLKLTEFAGRFLRYFGGLIIILTYFHTDIMTNIILGPSLMGLGSALFLISTSVGGSIKFSKTIQWYGKNSYEIYLFHIIILALMKTYCSPEALGPYTKLFWFGIFILLASLISGLISKFFSRPINQKLRFMITHSINRPVVIIRN